MHTTYTFIHKNTSEVYITEANNEEEAWNNLDNIFIDAYGWRLEEESEEEY